jgi:hypothetical protein
MLIRKIIRTDGTETAIDGILSITEIAGLLGADSLYSLDLDDDLHILLFDDEAYKKQLPVNKTANELFLKKHPTKDYVIRGDVVIIPGRDLDRNIATKQAERD